MRKFVPLVFVLFFALIAGSSLLRPGLPPTHDGEYHVVRFYEFDKALRSGSLYPRWAPDLNKGYGVPLFNYVYPLPNYIASFLHIFGMSFIDAFKLNMFAATIIGALCMYLWSRHFWGEWGGVIASVFYTYSPYHFLDIYIRGSVGEVWALALFPLFLWSVTKYIKEKNHFFVPTGAISLALIIFSHNILALMFFPFALTYIVLTIYKAKSKKNLLLNSFYIILLGIGLSSIFWLPALFERGYVRGLDIFDYSRHFTEPYQLIFPSWGSGFSADPTTQGLSFQIGIANLIALFIAIVLAIKKQTGAMSVFMIFWIFLAIFLMLPISQPIWRHIPLFQYFQFPWRFLSLVILCSSFLAGSVIFFVRSQSLWLVLLLFTVFLGLPYTELPYYHLRDDNYYTTKSNFIDGTNSPGNAFNTIWFNEKLPKRSTEIEVLQEGSMQEIVVKTAYFPGWQVFVDGKKVPTGVDNNGLIKVKTTLGKQKIEAKLLSTPVRTLATAISLLSFATVSFWFMRSCMLKWKI